MGRTDLLSLVNHCESLLKNEDFEDYPGAVNGLQAANRGEVTRIAAAVDGTFETIKLAAAAQANLLIVHHGLFWGPSHPWTGRRYELIRLLLENDIAVYSSHLPLDAHPELGNNAGLCAALGFKNLKPFFTQKNAALGLRTNAKIPRALLKDRLSRVLGAQPVELPGGPEICRKIGVVTGGAGAEMAVAAKEGVDTFITGEGPHWTYALAEDLGLNVFYGGHYATETFGVKALAEHLSKKFDLPWIFLDRPTGL